MKKKIFAILAVILCLSMLFVSCKKKDKGGDGEETDPPKSNEDVILDYLNGGNVNLNDAKGTAYEMLAELNLEMTNVKMGEEKFIDSATLSGGALYMKSGEEVFYTLIDKSMATLTLEYGAGGVSQANISLPDDFETADIDSADIPELAEADLIDEGNGVYSVSKEYILKTIEAILVASAGEDAKDESFKEELDKCMDILDDVTYSIKITVDGEQITKIEETIKASKAVCTAFITEMGVPDVGLDYFVEATSAIELKDGKPSKMTAKIDMCYPVHTMHDEGKMGVALVSTGGNVAIDLTKLDATATVADIKTYTNMTVKGFKQSGEKYTADKAITDEYAAYYGETKQSLELSIKQGKFSYANNMTSGSETMKQSYTADVNFEKKAAPELSAEAKAYVTKADKVFKNLDAVEKHAEDIAAKIAAKATNIDYAEVIYKYAEYDVYVEFYVYSDEGKVEVSVSGYTFIDEGYADYTATLSGGNVTLTPVSNPVY